MNIATFSTRDLWEQGCKSYLASYRANEELVIPRMFLANYDDKGDSRKFSSVDDSQCMVIVMHNNYTQLFYIQL